MTADERAALVEKVARKLAADTCGKESEWPLYMRRATAAIDLIRADVLEEAARVAEDVKRVNIDDGPDDYADGPTKVAIAAAIRALKEKA